MYQGELVIIDQITMSFKDRDRSRIMGSSLHQYSSIMSVFKEVFLVSKREFYVVK